MLYMYSEYIPAISFSLSDHICCWWSKQHHQGSSGGHHWGQCIPTQQGQPVDIKCSRTVPQPTHKTGKAFQIYWYVKDMLCFCFFLQIVSCFKTCIVKPVLADTCLMRPLKIAKSMKHKKAFYFAWTQLDFVALVSDSFWNNLWALWITATEM